MFNFKLEIKIMKKLVFAVCLAFGAVVVNAQDTTSTQSPTDPSATEQSQSTTPGLQEQGRVKIKSQDLPDAVKSSLEGQEYRGWLVNSAYKMDSSVSSDTTSTGDTGVSTDTTGAATPSTGYTGSGQQEVYIVELKNGAQTKTVRFDKDGKKLDDEDENDDQK
jgi:hypothetical protein